MLKWIVGALLFFLVVVELVFLAPSSGDRESESKTLGASDLYGQTDIEQVLSETRLIESQGEKRPWELVASVARKKKGVQDWELDDVEVEFYGENDVHYRCTGKKGYVTDNQQELKVQGDVVITSSSGYTLRTDLVFYRTKSRLIVGPEPVQIVGDLQKAAAGGPLYLQSTTFKADLNTNLIHLIDDVRGRKKLEDGRLMKIRSEKAQISGQNNSAIFREDVVMDLEQMRVTGPRAKFLYKDNQLDSLFIDGGVKIKDIGRWGVAGEALVFFREDKFIFRDNPKVEQGEDQLIGEEIIVYDRGERIQILKAKSKYSPKDQEESTN